MNRAQTYQLQAALAGIRVGLKHQKQSVGISLQAFQDAIKAAGEPHTEVVEPNGLNPSQLQGFETVATLLVSIREECLSTQSAWEVDVNERLTRLEGKLHHLAVDAA